MKVEMTETDKLLIRIGTARDAISRKTEQTSLDYMIDGVLMNCSVLLKEQETMNVDTFMQWCIDSHIMGDATVRGIKYWVEKFKEGR